MRAKMCSTRGADLEVLCCLSPEASSAAHLETCLPIGDMTRSSEPVFDSLRMDVPVRKRSLLLAGAALAATLPFASVQPASAATVCAQGKLCTWTKVNLSGTRENRTTPGHGCNPPQAGSNSIRSLSNQSGKTITVYSDTGCYGREVVIKSGQYSSALPFAGKSISW